MKTNSKIKHQLENLFKEVYTDKEQCESAVRDALKAYSFIKKDVLYKAQFENGTENI